MERAALKIASFVVIILMAASYGTPIVEVNAREIAGEVAIQGVTDSFGTYPNGIQCRDNGDCYWGQCPPKCTNNGCVGGRCICSGC
ncbi:hypothetical protein Tsubulata_046372 [Turnera subulata]|uniref:Uncharacterized protein n=1 Tax=Turnera subulata TaxID=218843 RepID=A0A9Q0F6R0_9ROSI|nr:hypothetical protein Tsubulata_049822 [Turnera subulata]KAJ4842065.1 hypothetical protein Tsubulata_046372 [Turnera subulata]